MEVYLVGGAVRDELLGLRVTEKDWVVVGSTEQQLLDAGYQPVGKDFPVFLHPKTHEEYALARTESKSGRGHKGFLVNANENITLEQDLQRRDLTINAIARDEAGNLIDLVGGRADLEAKVLRHVSPAFSDDPLRVLRVARFLSRFSHLGFTVSTPTLKIMREMISAGQLEELTPERVFIEIEKALNTTSPWKFFELLQEIGGLSAIGFHHVTIDLSRFSRICELNETPVIRYACLLSGADSESVRQVSQHLKSPKKYQEAAMLTANHYPTWASVHTLDASQIVEFLSQLDVYRRPERLEMLQLSCSALQKSNAEPADEITNRWLDYFKFTNGISARDIEQGLQGSEISQAIKTLRIKTIASRQSNDN